MNCAFVNRAYADFVGIACDEALGYDWRTLIHPDDVDRLVKESIAGEATLKTFTLEARYRRGDGAWRWLKSVSQPRWGPDGAHIGFIGVAHDVTDAKHSEAELRASEAQFRTLADNVPVLCWMARANGDIYWYNRRWYDYTGTTPDTQLGRGWEKVHDPDFLPRVSQRWAHSIRTGEVFEMTFPLRGADGVFRPFLTRVVPVHDAVGAVIGWFGSNTDVAVQAVAEAGLRELNETLEARVAEETAERRKAEESLRQAQRWKRSAS